MTYANGAPHPSDGRAYSDGGLVGHDVQVDLERRHQQLKLLRELEDAARRNQQQQPRPVYSRHPVPVPRLGAGPVIWNAAVPAPASSSSSTNSVSVSASTVSAITGRAPVPQTTKQQQEQQQEQQQQQQQEQQRRRFAAGSAGHVAPSIHTILEIARSSSGSHGQPSSSVHLTNTRRYYSKSPDQRHRRRLSPSSEASAGVIAGPHRPGQKAHEGRDQVRRQQKASSIPTTSTVAPSPPPQQQPVGTVPVGTFGGSGTPLRRGKWTKAEEEFAAATIRYFCGGLLNLQFGTLLRGFLAQQLHCHPMRISKKLLPGTTFCGVEISRKLGRRAYSPRWCDSPLATQQKLDAEDHLAELRAKFIASIEEEAADEMGEETRELCRAAERLSETSESRASTATASAVGSPPSDVKSETTRAGSPAVLQQQERYHHHQQQQQQMYQYNQQQQQVVGHKRTREDNEWVTAEQAQTPRTHHQQQHQQVHHHQNPHPQQHPIHQQQQHSYYSHSQTTNQRWGASPPVRSSPPQIWHSSSSPSSPSPPPLPSAAVAGAHAPTQLTVYYENAHRPAKLPRLHHQQSTQHQQYHQQLSENVHESQRPSAPSPPLTLPMLPPLRASLQRASTYQDHQHQQQGHQQQQRHQQHRL